MVGPQFDCLANPLGAVRITFDKAISSGFDPSTSTGDDWGAVDLFNQFLFENGGLSQVPVLNRANVNYLQSKTLVRFRGMIQDMPGNEFYAGAYKDGSTWRTNKFTDSQCQMEISPDMKLWERHLLYCVPVPGLNSWTETYGATIRNCISSDHEQGEKRQREDDEGDDHMDFIRYDWANRRNSHDADETPPSIDDVGSPSSEYRLAVIGNTGFAKHETLQHASVSIDRIELIDIEASTTMNRRVRFMVDEEESSEQDSEMRSELQDLLDAQQAGTAFILGHSHVKVKPGSSLVKKVAINFVYSFLRRNCRGPDVSLRVPTVSLLEVGMVYVV